MGAEAPWAVWRSPTAGGRSDGTIVPWPPSLRGGVPSSAVLGPPTLPSWPPSSRALSRPLSLFQVVPVEGRHAQTSSFRNHSGGRSTWTVAVLTYCDIRLLGRSAISTAGFLLALVGPFSPKWTKARVLLSLNKKTRNCIQAWLFSRNTRGLKNSLYKVHR